MERIIDSSTEVALYATLEALWFTRFQFEQLQEELDISKEKKLSFFNLDERYLRLIVRLAEIAYISDKLGFYSEKLILDLLETQIQGWDDPLRIPSGRSFISKLGSNQMKNLFFKEYGIKLTKIDFVSLAEVLNILAKEGYIRKGVLEVGYAAGLPIIVIGILLIVGEPGQRERDIMRFRNRISLEFREVLLKILRRLLKFEFKRED